MVKKESIFDPEKMDLHMHSTVSDGTDTPEDILRKMKEEGFELFSVTDHDAIKAGPMIRKMRREGDPAFLTGVEFSCKDEGGKYHILGYGYDPEAGSIRDLVEQGHGYRMEKVHARLDFLRDDFGFAFPEEEIQKLLALDNPGKPHIGNLMAKYGYAESKDKAITDYINKCGYRSKYVTPKEAIEGIIGSGGIPVLAHPPYGNGGQMIVGEAMDKRLRHLIGLGLQGLEGYYSRYTEALRREVLGFAAKYDLYVTAGSDYHGSNKTVRRGETGYRSAEEVPEGMIRFLQDIRDRILY